MKTKSLFFILCVAVICFIVSSCTSATPQNDQQTPVHLTIDGKKRKYVEINGCLYIKGVYWVTHDDAQCSKCKHQRERDMERLVHMLDSAYHSH